MITIVIKQSPNGRYRIKCGKTFLHGSHSDWPSAARRAMRHYAEGHLNVDVMEIQWDNEVNIRG